jgi:DNA-binding TFAR19-related protein (PDSD5 family)
LQKLNEEILELEAMAKKYMTSEAVARYGALKAAHQEKALQSIMIVTELGNDGKIPKPLTDKQYKELLVRLTPKKKEFKVTRK